ncbi:MAG: lysophospholipid acyltransferase family protein [Rubricoccaceae bacterium]|nr:lysophospholipid acyltransferase family protein [Rubricoccaceae bacterium]
MPLAAPPPGLRRRPPGPTLGTRLHFAWVMAWATLCTLVFSLAVFVEARVRPRPETLYRWMVPWARVLLRGIGVRLLVEHRTTLDAGPVVFVANHQNVLDIPTAVAGLPLPFGFTPKAALRGMPLVGTLLERTGNVFMDRSTARRAARSLVAARDAVRAGRTVLVYAEGERTWETALAPFLRGGFLLAVEAGVPLVPVAIDGNVGVVDERRLASRPGVARLVVGPPIETQGCTRADVPGLMEDVRAWMARELGLEGA